VDSSTNTKPPEFANPTPASSPRRSAPARRWTHACWPVTLPTRAADQSGCRRQRATGSHRTRRLCESRRRSGEPRMRRDRRTARARARPSRRSVARLRTPGGRRRRWQCRARRGRWKEAEPLPAVRALHLPREDLPERPRSHQVTAAEFVECSRFEAGLRINGAANAPYATTSSRSYRRRRPGK